MQAWLLLASVLPCAGFYLPGVAPIEYEKGHKVDLKVNKLTSTKTQLPYEWCGTPPQPHPRSCVDAVLLRCAGTRCRSASRTRSSIRRRTLARFARPSAPAQRCYPATLSVTRAQVMRGDRVMNSPYDIKMHIEESCKVRHAGCTERQREAAVGGPSVGPWQAIVGL